MGELHYIGTTEMAFWLKQTADMPMPIKGPEGDPRLSLAIASDENSSFDQQATQAASVQSRIAATAFHPDLITMIELEHKLPPSNKHLLDDHLDVLKDLGLVGVLWDLQQWHGLTKQQAEKAEEQCRTHVAKNRAEDLRRMHRRLRSL